MTSTPGGIPRRAWVEQIMGMPISVHVRGPGLDAVEVGLGVAAVFDELRNVERVFSPYRDDSDLSRWDRGDLSLEEADPTLPQVLELCELARVRTEGWFDPRDLPDPRGNGTTRYDPTGLVKGWAVRRASRHLAALPGPDRYGWCLNAGGDIAVASPEGHPPWRIGVENPFDPHRVLRVISLWNGAAATSGSAHRGAHIVDPSTGEPATGLSAVTVVGPDLLWADVFATAAVARGPLAIEWLSGIDGYQALLVDDSGGVVGTPGWPVP